MKLTHPAPSQVRFPVQPRLVPAIKAARRLHLTLSEFDAKLPALRKSGFPCPCSVTGHYDLVAIDAWLDERAKFNAGATAEEDQEYMRRRILEIG